jgi:Family of unknown function (DUF6200)
MTSQRATLGLTHGAAGCYHPALPTPVGAEQPSMDAKDPDLAEVNPPLIVNMGKQRRKRVKDLKRGRGRLVQTVQEVIEEVREELGADAKDKVLIPVVVLFERKQRKRKRRKGGFFPFF